MRFFRYHALGNDYIVIREEDVEGIVGMHRSHGPGLPGPEAFDGRPVAAGQYALERSLLAVRDEKSLRGNDP